MAINQSILKAYANNYRNLSESVKNASMENFSSTFRRSAFLCHSHTDEVLVQGLIAMFQSKGINLYVDWKDHTMPASPNAETAKKIQGKIRKTDMFLFLATANSKASRWCPWEIGYADSSGKTIYILPTTDGHDTYGNEYLELYPKIDTEQYGTIANSRLLKKQPWEYAGTVISTEGLL
jgi:hypothetical protein